MHFGTRERFRFLMALSILAVLGIAATVYMLGQQRFPNPLRDTYTIRAALTEADGVVAGLGQPVNVSGVKVGTVTATDHDTAGNAVLTLEIERDDLPHVREGATVTLEPITPLKDMQVALDPGHPPARPLKPGALVGTEETASPVSHAALLSSLDADTRAFLTALLASLERGTTGRGPDLRRALRALGPTTAQLRAISTALDGRRAEIARLVHNVSVVARAASRDRRLASVARAGEQTLRAVARQDRPLSGAIARLPGTLSAARTTLGRAARFSDELGPTLDALMPAVRRLPRSLDVLKPFADDAAAALRTQIRPLVREAQPTVTELGPAIQRLSSVTPELFDSVQASNYFLNELAYNPPGDDEGGLFWASWFAHNMSSVFSLGEAHGGAGRASVLLNCQQATNTLDLGRALKVATGSANLCPKR